VTKDRGGTGIGQPEDTWRRQEVEKGRLLFMAYEKVHMTSIMRCQEFGLCRDLVGVT